MRILSRDALAVLGAIVVAVFVGTTVAVSLFGNNLVPYDPNAINVSDSFAAPSLQHLMGTDNLGRDIFSRVVVATPIDAEIGLSIVGISLVVGLIVGSVAGYFGDKTDDALMRITDTFLAIPLLVLAVAVAVALGPGVDHVIEANAIAWWPVYARMARAGALSLRGNQYIEAAHVAGLSHLSIIRSHIIPNNISSLLVYATLDIGNAILYASVLSYLGVGAQPPQAEWGRMVFEGQTFLGSAWWVPLMPGIVLLVVALGFNLLGDSIRDFLDPRYRK
jgi:peptide/nickel transport system permease protein